MAEPIFGIDVSYAQGEIDWNSVANDGIKFAIIRAGYGMESDQVDGRFYQNIQEALAAGIECGIYWYSYATNTDEAYREAQLCCEVIENYDITYPVAFDIEDPSQMNLSSSTWSTMADTFCSYVKDKGYTPAIYSYASALRTKFSDEVLSKYDVFLSHFVNYTDGTETNDPDHSRVPLSDTSYEGSYALWQFSNNGQISGISGNVDLDYCYKTYSSSGEQSKPSSSSIAGYFSHPLRENYSIPFSSHSGHSDGAIDFACPEGTNVYSISDGIVAAALNNHASMGNAIVIQASNTNYQDEDLFFRYLHLSELKVEEGQYVQAGQLIGLSGNTGQSTGPHLHIDLLSSIWGDIGHTIMLPKDRFNSRAVQGYRIIPEDYSGAQDQIDTYASNGPYLRAILAQNIVNVSSDSDYSGDVATGIKLTPNSDTIADDIFRQQYFQKQFTEDFMGHRPSELPADGSAITQSDIDFCPSLWATFFAMHEFGGGGTGNFSYSSNLPEYNTALMSAKMHRCSIMAPPGSVYTTDWTSLKSWIDVQYFTTHGYLDEMRQYYTKTQDFIDFSELIYKNLRYPLAYGITDNTDVVAGNGRYYAMSAGFNDNETAYGAPDYGYRDETYTVCYGFVENLNWGQAWLHRYAPNTQEEPSIHFFERGQMEDFIQ